jgi:hypothetical protein
MFITAAVSGEFSEFIVADDSGKDLDVYHSGRLRKDFHVVM